MSSAEYDKKTGISKGVTTTTIMYTTCPYHRNELLLLRLI
eukprot:COSAG02_NODE_12384_length_1555_cov_2.844780_5_plen_40_part_00